MPERTMGSHTDLSVSEAAVVLGVHPNTVMRFESAGLLKRKNLKFPEDEVYELAALRANKDNDRLVAKKALAIAKRAERELEGIKKYLGMNAVRLGVEKEEVVSFFLRVEKIQVSDLLNQPATQWIDALLAVDENYLDLVHEHTGEPEPWHVFMRLAQMLYEVTPGTEEKAKVDYVRRNVRNVSYFYARRELGVREAKRSFKDDSFTDRLVNLMLIPDQQDTTPSRKYRRRCPTPSQEQ